MVLKHYATATHYHQTINKLTAVFNSGLEQQQLQQKTATMCNKSEGLQVVYSINSFIVVLWFLYE